MNPFVIEFETVGIAAIVVDFGGGGVTAFSAAMPPLRRSMDVVTINLAAI